MPCYRRRRCTTVVVCVIGAGGASGRCWEEGFGGSWPDDDDWWCGPLPVLARGGQQAGVGDGGTAIMPACCWSARCGSVGGLCWVSPRRPVRQASGSTQACDQATCRPITTSGPASHRQTAHTPQWGSDTNKSRHHTSLSCCCSLIAPVGHGAQAPRGRAASARRRAGVNRCPKRRTNDLDWAAVCAPVCCCVPGARREQRLHVRCTGQCCGRGRSASRLRLRPCPTSAMHRTTRHELHLAACTGHAPTAHRRGRCTRAAAA